MPSRNLFRYYSLQKEAAGIKLSEIERGIKVLGIMENSRLLNRKAQILWELEKFQGNHDRRSRVMKAMAQQLLQVI